MKLRHLLLLLYIAVGLLYGLYAYFFGATSNQGLFYNLGQGIVWPAVMFPALGKLIGGLIWLVVIAALVFFGSKGAKRKDRHR